MDQIKIGKFIAEKRKELNLTQVQLAEKLGVSDKSVSKWERGVCLPEVSLYQDLCKFLGISINEFFAGEVIEEAEVAAKSEENIMNIAEDGSNRDRKNRARLMAMGLIIVLLVAGMTYAAHILNRKGYFLKNYVRVYSTTAEGEAIRDIMTVGDSMTALIQFGVDESYDKVTLVVDKYEGNDLVSSEDVLCDEPIEGTGIVAAIFNPDKSEYSLTIADNGGKMSISGLSVDVNKDSDGRMSSMSYMSEDSIKITKGEEIPIVAFFVSTGENLSGYPPEIIEEMYGSEETDNDYTVLIKLRFE